MSDITMVTEAAPDPTVRPLNRDEWTNVLQCSPRSRLLDASSDPSGTRYLRERVGWMAEVKGHSAGSAVCTLVRPIATRDDATIVRSLIGFILRLLGRGGNRPLRVELLDVVVAPGPMSAMVEHALLNHLVEKLDGTWGCNFVVVPESNVTAQLCLRDARYRAIRVLRGHYGDEDGYLMGRVSC